jgi:hypothetical protein
LVPACAARYAWLSRLKRRRIIVSDPVKVAGITWYTRENYAACREIMSDKHILPFSYDDWEKKAEAQIKPFENNGWRVVKVMVHVDEFKKWCATRNLDIDAKARIRFANETAFRSAKN